MAHQMSGEMRDCASTCLECYAACVECAAHCASMGGEHADPAHLGALADCAVLCEAAANLMLRSSPLHAELCRACAEACERCAQSCERLASGDEMMERCAAICRRCAESCREMAAMV